MSFDWFLSIYIYTLFWCFFLFFFSFRSLGRKQHRWQWALCLFHSPDDNNVISYFFFFCLFVCLIVFLFLFFLFVSLLINCCTTQRVCVKAKEERKRKGWGCEPRRKWRFTRTRHISVSNKQIVWGIYTLNDVVLFLLLLLLLLFLQFFFRSFFFFQRLTALLWNALYFVEKCMSFFFSVYSCPLVFDCFLRYERLIHFFFFLSICKKQKGASICYTNYVCICVCVRVCVCFFFFAPLLKTNRWLEHFSYFFLCFLYFTINGTLLCFFPLHRLHSPELKTSAPWLFFPPSPFDLLYFVIITIIIRFLFFFYYYFVEGYVSKEQEKKMWLL